MLLNGFLLRNTYHVWEKMQDYIATSQILDFVATKRIQKYILNIFKKLSNITIAFYSKICKHLKL